MVLRILCAVVFLSSLGFIFHSAVNLQVTIAQATGESVLVPVLTVVYYIVVAALTGVFWFKLQGDDKEKPVVEAKVEAESAEAD